MKISKETLANGLRVIVAEIPDVELVSTNVSVGAGGRYEKPELWGISHFLEHIVFKGTKNYPTPRALAEAIESIGGVKNAMTGDDYTSYWNKVPKAHLKTALTVLKEQVFEPLIREEDIDRERGVILEEINMVHENPMHFTLISLQKILWEGQNAASDVLGTTENIKRFKQADFNQYRELFYQTDNITISIAGGVKSEEVLEMVREIFGQIKPEKAHEPEPILINQKAPKIKVVERPYKQAHVALAYKSFGLGDPRKQAFDVLMTLLGDGMGSILFEEIREKRGLAYAVVSAREYYSDAGAGIIYVGLNGEKALEAVQVVKDSIERVKRGEFKDSELRRAKEYLKGHLAGQTDGTENVSLGKGLHELLNPKGPETAKEIELIDAVTKEDVIKVATQILIPERENLMVVGPFSDEEKFVKILTSKGE